ncbi:dna mismatch repair protein msh2 [Phaffia rhodozyma]|uniref:Dna mismatch repair protein msh2 n=1 Tax=Phaffia rhodozyma TaxID=264483 RepID=A0A0F7SJ43_PHARH|nr:dna mismatch repair protein msh2 [Phaffia rhodozyma]
MYGKEPAGEKTSLDMDNAAEVNFIRQFENLPKKLDGTIRLFDRVNYYSCHGEDAILIASIVYNTSNAIKFIGSKTKKWPLGLPSVTLNQNAAKGFLRDALTARQMKIEIYSQEGTGRPNQPWLLTRQASPGNISQLEDLLFTNHDLLTSPIVMAIKVMTKDGVRTVGAAFADVSSRELGVAEFADNDLFSNTESLLIQLSVKECIIQADDKRTDYDLAKIRTMLERCGVIATETRASEFNPKNVEQDLNRLLNPKHAAQSLPQLNLKTALYSVSALISHLSLLTDATTHGSFSLRTHDLSQHMKLDASALSALNLLPTPGDIGGKNSSLYGLLNRCKTPQGQRLLRVWLKQPLVNKHEIERRQSLVETFVEDAEARRTLQSVYLKVMPDFSRLSKRLQRRMASLEDVVRIYQAVLRLPELIDTLEGIQLDKEDCKIIINEVFVNQLKEYSTALEGYIELVESTIDLNELGSHNYVIKSDFDDTLQSIKDQLIQARDGLDSEHERVGRELGLDIEKKLHLENQQVYGYCLRVTKAEASVIRNKRGYIELGTQKSGTYFTTSALKEFASSYQDLSRSYSKAQDSLVKEVVEIASTYIPVFETLDTVIANLDVIVSFADISISAPIPYVKPIIKEMGSGNCIIKEGRHPCLEVQDEVTFIPNDVEFLRDTAEFQIVSGPNMGGKSTYLRQVGVIALMSQIGCFVPATEAEMPIFDCVLARVGAGDSQLKGISTFMAEMLETATILRTATSSSLLLIDELGRGTSTYDGFGLAWAISEYIVTKIKAFSLFATHFHELTTLAHQNPTVRNLQVKARIQDKDITFLYTVEPGVSGQSYGIHVAELAKFPESVVKMAKRKADELEDFGDDAEVTPDDSNPFTKYSREETEEGTKIVKQFLNAWSSRVPSSSKDSGVDEKSQATLEEELAILREIAAEYRDQIEANPYTRSLLDSF